VLDIYDIDRYVVCRVGRTSIYFDEPVFDRVVGLLVSETLELRI